MKTWLFCRAESAVQTKFDALFEILKYNSELFDRLLGVVEANQEAIEEIGKVIADFSVKVDNGMKALSDKFDVDFKEMAEDLDQYLPDSR